MKAMLLAAGHGTRLRPLTDDRPKCMVPVAGREVILRNIDWLRSHDVRDIVINLHHRPESVVNLLGSGSAMDVHVAYSREAELLGTAGALVAARKLIGEEAFLVVYADNLFDVHLDRLVATHRQSGAVATMALLEREDVSASGVAEITETGWISEFREKPAGATTGSHWINGGLLVLEPDVYGMIPADRPSDLSSDVMPILARRHHGLRGHRIGADERVLWIDTKEDLSTTEATVAGAIAVDAP